MIEFVNEYVKVLIIYVCINIYDYEFKYICLGDTCNTDFNGCFDNPCMTGTNCTDFTPAEQVAANSTFNCTSCPTGLYKFNCFIY